MTDNTSQLLAPLARGIATAIRDTPVRLGTPEGAADLVAQITVKAAAFMGSVLPSTPGVAQLMVDVDAERQRQLAKFGDQRHPDGTDLSGDQARAENAREVCHVMAGRGKTTWRGILAEEVAEAYAESDPAKLRAELVQVAAVCAAWISDIDRRPTP